MPARLPSSAADRTCYRSAMHLQFVATHVDHDLSAIGSAGSIELGRNYDSQARGLFFIHSDKEKVPLSEAEDGNLGGIVKFDNGQVSKRRWNIKRQVSGLQIRTADRLTLRGSRKAARCQKREATGESNPCAAGDGGDALHDRSYGQDAVAAIGCRRFQGANNIGRTLGRGQIAYSAGAFASRVERRRSVLSPSPLPRYGETGVPGDPQSGPTSSSTALWISGNSGQ
jgi:hypothetical protein